MAVPEQVAVLERGMAQVVQQLQAMTAQLQDLDARQHELANVMVRQGGRGEERGAGRRQEVSQSKAVAGMKVLGGTTQRNEYKEWHEKFVNIMSQLRPGTRKLWAEK